MQPECGGVQKLLPIDESKIRLAELKRATPVGSWIEDGCVRARVCARVCELGMTFNIY